MKPGNRGAVCVIGGSLWGNRGAEAMVTTCVGEARRRLPGCDVHIFSYFPDEDRRLLGAQPGVSVRDGRPVALVLRLLPGALACRLLSVIGIRAPDWILPRDLVELRRAGVLLDVSGISFADGRELFLLHNVFILLPALLLDVPVFKVSQAMGPFRGFVNRTVARFFLPRCSYVVARGHITAMHLADLRLPTNQWGRHRDSAFAFRDEYSLTDEGQAVVDEFEEWLSASQGSDRKIVGICPSSVVYSKSVKAKKDYLASLSDILIGALRAGHRVAVIPNATREGHDTLRNNDLPVIRMLRDRVRREAPPALADAVFWTDSDINTARLRRIIRRFDLLLTSRFHAMIAALSQEVPTVVIGWSHKYQEVLVDFSLENSCFDYAAEHIGEIQTRIAQILDPAFRSGWPPPGRTSSIAQSARDQFELALGPDPCVSGEPDSV